MKKLKSIILLFFLLLVSGFTFLDSDILLQQPEDTSGVIHAVYFYSDDCPHCKVIDEELLQPLLAEYGEKLDIKFLEIGVAENYELLINAENYFNVAPEDRQLPDLVIGEQILIGETEIRENLNKIIDDGFSNNGIDWPEIPGLDTMLNQNSELSMESPLFSNGEEVEYCDDDEDGCDTENPIWAAYFFQTGCQECSRVEADIEYIQTKHYPNLIVEEFNINDHADMAAWLQERACCEELHTPAFFVGDEVLTGEDQITPDAIKDLLGKYAETGSEKVWENYDPVEAKNSIIENFKSLKPLTIVFAGLIDGLNPCAFATIIFFVSYLTLSGRKGREILEVGAAFTVGVFLAYFVIGLGFYKVLDLLGDLLTTLGRWVYGITAVLCAGLAVFSFFDFLKARKGEIGDMALNLPEGLRKRINQVIRKGRNTQAYVIGAFVTGIVISFLELACTGQIYIPTIIFVSSIPELRGKATMYLLIYNFFFTVPLIVVFIMAYYGTSSADLKKFFEKNAAKVKLGMTLLFAVLAIWLGFSLLS